MPRWRTRPAVALVATSAAAFTATLDNTVVAVALRDIQADLGSSVLGLQGVVTAYVVALAALLLAGGGLVDVLGARRVTSLGLVVFAVASALCASADSVAALVGWRAVQGAGAALLLPGSLAVLAGAYPEVVARRRAVATWAAVSGAALVAGPVVGGRLVAGYGWPAVFWVNVPLCAVVLLLLPPSRRPRGRRGAVDVPGALLSCLALGSVTYAVVLAGRDGLSGNVLVLLTVAIACLPLLRAAERRATAPLLPSSLLRHPRFVGATLAAFAAALAVFVLMVFLSLFLQLVQDRDASSAGTVLLALPLALVTTAVLTSRWRAVTAPVALGLVVAGAGLAGLATVLDTGVSARALEGWLLVVGAGCGLTIAPVVTATLEVAGEERAGLASAAVTVARELGGVVAVGGLGALAVARLTDRLTATMVGTGVPEAARPGMLDALLSADKREVRRQLVDAVGVERALGAYQGFVAGATESFVTSTRWVLGAGGTALVLLALVSAGLLRRR